MINASVFTKIKIKKTPHDVYKGSYLCSLFTFKYSTYIRFASLSNISCTSYNKHEFKHFITIKTLMSLPV